MKKYQANYRVVATEHLNGGYGLIKLQPAKAADVAGIEVLPGQFVQVEIAQSKNTYLRRPISVCNYDSATGELWLLVRRAGEGTATLIESRVGDEINLILPLGKGFSFEEYDAETLLVGGGVGVAPLLYLGRKMKERNVEPTFLLGARSSADLLLLDEFKKYGTVHVCTDDGSLGEHGVVTQHSIFSKPHSMIACCGPLPMMKAVARAAGNARCEVSLENVMACGLGACLCCVEDTVNGNVCVCKEGPVFNIDKLKW